MRSDDTVLPALLDAGAIHAWDATVDVLIVGGGMAGVCAALEAARAGAETLIVERYSGCGGTSALAAGHFYLGGGTAVQVATGIDDSPEEMEKYLNAIAAAPIPDKIHAFSHDSVAQFDWLERQGIPFERSFFAEKAVVQPGTEGLMYTGNEETFPYRDMARPAARGHKVQFPGGEGGGGLAMRHLVERLAEAGVRVMTDARVTALVHDGDGVCGVRIVAVGAGVSHVRARRGVILAGGGFGQNRAMLEQYAPAEARMGDRIEFIGAPGEDGSAIRLGQSAGGRTLHMQNIFMSTPFYPPEKLVKGILVNRDGERFVAEDSYHSRSSVAITRQPGGIAWLILDNETFDYPLNKEWLRHELVDGWDSVEAMEDGLGIARGALRKTLDRYNADCAAGRDTAFGKHPKKLKTLDHPPYAAFDVSWGRANFMCFTLGGLETTVDGHVVAADGQPIPGLYAAGSCASALTQTSENYASGTSLAQASYFGRRAGFAAAHRRADSVPAWRA